MTGAKIVQRKKVAAFIVKKAKDASKLDIEGPLGRSKST